MKKLSILMLSLVVGSFVANAQQQQPMHFDNWAAKPQMHPIPVHYFNEHAVMLLNSEKRDYVFEGSGITMYSTVHKLIKVLDKKGIEEFNQITVPFTQDESRVDSVKARVILPNGTTHDLTYRMLYIGSGGLFFALDDVEKNAEIELLIQYKAVSSYFGSIYFQYDIPVLNTYFELNYPKEMFMNLKGYHGFPSGNEEMVHGHKQVKIYQAEIPALEDEDHSYYDLYRMRLEYGVDHFVSRGGYQRYDQYTYDKLAQNMYTRFYDKNMLDRRLPNRKNVRLDQVGFKESEQQSIGKFLTAIGIRGTETDRQKIRMIEEGIKTTVLQHWELEGNGGENLDTIVAKKTASPVGMVKLFSACFRAVGIDHEIGKVSDRSEHLMDGKFINWAPLEDYVFYFPDFNAYMAPSEPYYRFPEVPYSMLNNKGVFVRTNPEMGYVVGSDVAEATADIRKITPDETHPSTYKATTEISIGADMSAMADITCAYTGYNAADVREELAKAPKQKIKEIIKGEVKLAERQEDLIRYSTSNESFNAVYQEKPLIINGIVRVPYMVEKAGNRYLVNVGKAIGQQESLYDDDERILPVDLDYPYTNTHTVTVNIPQDYKITEIEGLKSYVEETDRDNGNTLAYFKSDYTITGNKLVITVTESHPKIHYAVREYNDFRKVINAAADFNKAVVVIESKKKPVVKRRKAAKATTVLAVVPTNKGAAAKPAAVKPATVKPVAPAAMPKPMPQPKPAASAKPGAMPNPLGNGNAKPTPTKPAVKKPTNKV